MSSIFFFDGVHLHLALNHFPVIGLPLLLLFSIVAWIKKNQTLQLASCYGVIFVCILALSALKTGEMAYDQIEHLRPSAEQLIENHEEAAEKIIWLAALSGFLALAGIFLSLRRQNISNRLFIALIISLVFSSIGFAWVANLGGQISHPEIRGPDHTSQGDFLKNNGKENHEHEDR